MLTCLEISKTDLDLICVYSTVEGGSLSFIPSYCAPVPSEHSNDRLRLFDEGFWI